MTTTDKKTPQELIAEALALDAKATPGPWTDILPALADALEQSETERERLRVARNTAEGVRLRLEEELREAKADLDEARTELKRRGEDLEAAHARNGKLMARLALRDESAAKLAQRDGEVSALRAQLAAASSIADRLRGHPEVTPAPADPNDEDSLLTPMCGGHVFAGTWEQWKGEPCAACGGHIGAGSLCPGWPREGRGDALRRVARAVVREAPNDGPCCAHEAALERFGAAFDKLCDLLEDDRGPGAEKRNEAKGKAAAGYVLLVNRLADLDRTLRHAVEASDPHRALRSFMSALPSTDMVRERGPVEDAFAKLDALLEEHDAALPVCAAVEELADVIRVRLREVATFAIAWRDTVREHARSLEIDDDARARIGARGTSSIARESVVIDGVRLVAERPLDLREAGPAMASHHPAQDTLAQIGRDVRAARDRHASPKGRLDGEQVAEVPVFEWREPATAGDLREELARKAAEHHEDVVLHALTVVGGAQAIGVGSPMMTVCGHANEVMGPNGIRQCSDCGDVL